MKCRKCGTENDSSNKFCRNCGDNIQEVVLCQNCGFRIEENALFCSNCGTQVGELNLDPSESANPPLENIELEGSNEETLHDEQVGETLIEIEDSAPVASSNVTDATDGINESNAFGVTDKGVTNEVTDSSDVSVGTCSMEAGSPTDTTTESDNIADEETNVPPAKKNNHRKWIIAGIALVIAAVGAFILFFKIDTVLPNTQISSVQTNTNAMDDIKMAIESVYTTEYPLVKVQIAIEGGPKGLKLSKDKLVINENQQVQEVKEIKQLEEDSSEENSGKTSSKKKLFEITYETLVVNSKPPSGEQRKIDLTYMKANASSTYMSPKQSKLRVDSFSCNTDDYPNISCFFSLFDQNNNEMDNITFDPKYIKLAENQTSVGNVSISKLAEEAQFTSTNLVIDISTSMDEYDRIGQVKNAVNSFLNSASISKKNLVGVLSFADSEYISQVPFTSDINAIANEVNSFQTVGSCTALYESINEAVFNTSYNGKNGSKYVIAFTDGQDNCSDLVSSQTLINNAQQLGVPIYAVSVDHDPELQRIAEETQGQYSYLGNDIAQLNYFYQDIFKNKQNQYVLSYKSTNPKKNPRNLQMALLSPTLYTDTTTENVTPKLLNDYEVADVMQKYQIAWSEAMNQHDISPILPYVTQNRPETDKKSVYNIVYEQIYGTLTSSGNRIGGLINVNSMYGEELIYQIPDYALVDAEKVSDEHYRLRIQKRVQRDATLLKNRNNPSLGFNSSLTTYKETAYTYNVIKVNGTWVIDTVDDEAVPICYKDSTYTEKYQRKDGKSSKTNGNCPGVPEGER